MSELLQTKLAPPRAGQMVIARPALLARLDEGLSRRLCLLAAPAGFGKTTLARAWLEARAPDVAVAWLTLDQGDNDPARFWRYMIAACRILHPALGPEAGDLLAAPPPVRVDALLTALINALVALPRPSVLVLEEYHTIGNPQIHAAIGFLIEHMPAHLQICLIARSDPDLPLARLRARDDIVELHTADLRFSDSEIAAFLSQAVSRPLARDMREQLAERSQGWPAGLRLMALALQGRGQGALDAISGSHQQIAAYLVSEVLAAQPPAIQQFLLETSCLTRLSAELCDALAERADSRALLDAVAQSDLFLTALDDRRRWFRYHPLFAEAMRAEAMRRLGGERVAALQLRASHWYAGHSLLDEAIEAALAGQHYDLAAAQIDRLLDRSRALSELFTLRRWIAQLPETLLPSYPELCLAYATAILFLGDRSAPETLRQIEAPLELAERAWHASGNQARQGAALVVRSLAAWWQGDYPQSFQAARHALALLPRDEHSWRGSAMLCLGAEALAAGQLQQAQALVLDARATCDLAGNAHASRAATLMLAEIAAQRGAAYEAAQLCQQVLDDADDDPVDRAHATLGLAALAYARGDLDSASQLVAKVIAAIDTPDAWPSHAVAQSELRMPAALLHARILLARGEADAAQRALAALAGQQLRHGGEVAMRSIRAEQARLALARGDLAAVQRWAQTIAQRSDPISRMQEEREALIVARWLIARQEAVAALRALDHWLVEVRAEQRAQSELVILAILALAHAANRQPAEAAQALHEALRRTEADDWRQLLVEEGEPLRRLCEQARPGLGSSPADRLMRERLDALIAAFPQPGMAASAKAAAPIDQSLIEPLSAQEQRVLQLLGGGLSNAEIAEELVVSINTVKTHVQNVFRKLGVASRREARRLAQQNPSATLSTREERFR